MHITRAIVMNQLLQTVRKIQKYSRQQQDTMQHRTRWCRLQCAW